MSELPVSEADLQAYADGRLTPERRAVVDAWLAAHPEEAERVAAYQRLGKEVRAAYEAMLAEPVPERLAQAAPDTTIIARRAAIAHATYSPEVRHPVEVGADDEQHLVAWLSKRLGIKVRAPKLDEAGMSLVGGRLLPGDNGPVAQFMYQSQNGRRLTLYVRTEASRNRETAFRYALAQMAKVTKADVRASVELDLAALQGSSCL